MTRVYGLVGWPIEKSLSPAMHRAAFAACGIDAVYGAFPVAPGGLPEAVRGLRALGIAGANVTVPHKLDVVALLDDIDAVARDIGAVNTIMRRADGSLAGTNTDVAGLTAALAEDHVTVSGARVVVVGAGGAARAAVAAVHGAGAAHVTVVARDVARAKPLVARWSVTPVALAAPELADAFAQSSLLVNATPEAALDLPLAYLPGDAVVVDLSYGPDNALLSAARARGLRAIDGLGMLLHQGALSFEAWTGTPAPLAAMRAALSV